VSLEKKVKARAKTRAVRVRAKLRNSDKPRVTVFRSNRFIYAQLIDDSQHKTLASASSLNIKEEEDKSAQAKAVGLELAKKALEAGISSIAFDRGKYLYHGRIKALAEGLREGGLKF
jgi:large subunit ribosomal protein L18